jgi:hypothetical protein
MPSQTARQTERPHWLAASYYYYYYYYYYCTR